MPLSEFDLIERFFANASRGPHVRLGIGDDAALVASGAQTAVAIDTCLAGVHFPEDAPAAAVGHKVLAVNLSDLAAMGAVPSWAVLALTLPAVDEAWLEAFAGGLLALADAHGASLIGGDTTRGPLAATVTVGGAVEHALLRSGARPGDRLWVSGNPGEAACGLRCWRHGPRSDAAAARLIARLHWPEPRVGLGRALVGLASAAIDVSDGLVADARHIASASGVGMRLAAAALPCSAALREVAGEDALEYVLNGGDDYELCFTAPQEADATIAAAGKRAGVAVTAIGEVVTGDGVQLHDAAGATLNTTEGYRHFG